MKPHCLALSLMLAIATACASAPGSGAPRDGSDIARTVDTSASDLLPPGFGTLRQDDIAIKIQVASVLVRSIPLDESVARLLSPDSYRALRDLQESKRELIAELARRHNVRRPSLWYVSFYGLQPEARFSPLEVVISSTGREFRPLGVVPLSPGFGEQRLAQREVQSAIYLFDEGINVNQPLTVTFETAHSSSWEATLRALDRERALVRSRAAGVQKP